jgi:hypothetical protein
VPESFRGGCSFGAGATLTLVKPISPADATLFMFAPLVKMRHLRIAFGVHTNLQFFRLMQQVHTYDDFIRQRSSITSKWRAPVVKLAARLNPDRAGQQVARALDVALAHPAGPVLLDCLAEDTDWCRSSATIDRRTSGGYTLTQSVLNFLRRFVH